MAEGKNGENGKDGEKDTETDKRRAVIEGIDAPAVCDFIPLTSMVKVAVLLPALFDTLTLYSPASFGLMLLIVSPVCQGSVRTDAWTPLEVSGAPLKNQSTVGSGWPVKPTSILTLVPDRQLITSSNRLS